MQSLLNKENIQDLICLVDHEISTAYFYEEKLIAERYIALREKLRAMQAADLTNEAERLK